MHKAIIGAIFGFFAWAFMVSVQTSESRRYFALIFSDSLDATSSMLVILSLFVVLGAISGICWSAITRGNDSRNYRNPRYMSIVFEINKVFFEINKVFYRYIKDLYRDKLSKFSIISKEGIKFIVVTVIFLYVVSLLWKMKVIGS